MNIKVIEATSNPLDVISLAAGTCFGKSDTPHKRVANCVKAGHMSVLEHAKITLKVEGISRACMAQLTRHRLASFCVESQRYNKYDLSGDDWFVVPPEFTDERAFEFALQMGVCAGAYKRALLAGIKPEDARYLLPEATKTNLVMTMNVREVFHFLDMRTDKAAQWEIRQLAFDLIEAVSDHDPQWRELLSMWAARQNGQQL